MVWAELWYNTTYHKSLQTTPFKVLYGRDPPALVRFEPGSTSNFELETVLRERDMMLESLKSNLLRAQDIMKRQADKSRRDVELVVGDMVYLKLQPYRQKTVARRFCQKLAAKFYGPYRVLDRIGATAYKLQLPEVARVHPVFHISQLKLALGPHDQSKFLPPGCIVEEEDHVLPEDVLDKRYGTQGELELLIHWQGKPSLEDFWMSYEEFRACFPTYQLEGKLDFDGGGGY